MPHMLHLAINKPKNRRKRVGNYFDKKGSKVGEKKGKGEQRAGGFWFFFQGVFFGFSFVVLGTSHFKKEGGYLR